MRARFSTMAFIVLDLSLEAVRRLRPLVERLRLRDRDLADQIPRAAGSVVLNIGEGNERVGRDRTDHFRVAIRGRGHIEVRTPLCATNSQNRRCAATFLAQHEHP